MTKKKYIGIGVITLILLLWFLLTQNQSKHEALLYPSPMAILESLRNNYHEFAE